MYFSGMSLAVCGGERSVGTLSGTLRFLVVLLIRKVLAASAPGKGCWCSGQHLLPKKSMPREQLAHGFQCHWFTEKHSVTCMTHKGFQMPSIMQSAFCIPGSTHV